MEFPDFGKRCCVESCHQLDFLPFTCENCKRIFCLEHREMSAHSCQTENASQSSRDGLQILKRFFKKGLVATDVDKQPLDTPSYKCYLEECKTIELVPVACPDCHKNFCLRHRHQKDHLCVNLIKDVGRDVDPKEKVQSIIGRELKTKQATKPKSAKSSKTAAKVALMKLKMHATGDKGIPQNDREYFSIRLQNGVNDTQIFPMFFSKVWTIGRIIDYIAESKKIANKNNLSGEKKLHLVTEDNTILDPSERLQDVITNNLIDLTCSRDLKLSYEW